MLQVLVSIQGLILVDEPYYNEAGYEKHRDTQQGKENSRMYNEMAVLKLFQSMTSLLKRPVEVFKEEIASHFGSRSKSLVSRLKKWKEMTDDDQSAEIKGGNRGPDFPLLPLSKGFCISLEKNLEAFEKVLKESNL